MIAPSKKQNLNLLGVAIEDHLPLSDLKVLSR